MTTQTLDKIIDRVYGPTQDEHDCFGNFEDKQFANKIATEYADSPEVKRKHWDEFCVALAKDDLVPIIDETGWMSESTLDRGDDFESLYVRLGLVG